MKMTQLLQYAIPPEMILLWQQQESETLLPLQEMAVKRYDLFGEGNLLIQAPTSSGKTFIGEMAAIQTALRRKKVVYLVPLKALAEEKFREFSEKYTAYGLKVIISTRDRREYDVDLEQGEFSIAVVVYEKLSQLLVRRPERLEEIDLILADELELLSDPERGSLVEILLTRILQSGQDTAERDSVSRCRLIGLSAVIGQAEQLAAWMRAQLVYQERRPVELRYGVLHDGTFRYRTYNGYSEEEEGLVAGEGDSPWDTLRLNVQRFVEQNESCLIFVKSKHEARRCAESLAQQLEGAAANDAMDDLRRLESTRSRDGLLHTLNNGIAFHNADLSTEERRIIEQAFRQGEIQIMVSTSTLAAGLNMPARNVFLSAEKWRYDKRLDMPWKTPLLRGEYENMSGRAGRYGAGHAFGRSILIASTPFDFETLWRRYVEGEREPIEPRLARESLEDHVLRLVASRTCCSQVELLTFLERTLSGQWIWRERYTLDEIASHIRTAVNRCVDAGVVALSGEDQLHTTPLGAAVASKGIGITTARALEQWIASSEMREWSDLDLLLAVALTEDGRMPQVMLTAREYEQADYPEKLKRRTLGEPLEVEVPLNRIRGNAQQPFFEEVRAIKIVLFLQEFAGMAAIRDLEEQYNTMAGQIFSAAEQVSWLLDATAALATALGARNSFIQRIRSLGDQVQYGVCEALLPLARQHLPEVHRSALLALYGEGLHTPEALLALPPAALSRRFSRDTGQALLAWAREQGCAQPQPPASAPPDVPKLVVDDATPGEVQVNGIPVSLQEKQYRLIRLLAEFAGACVPYETIYDTVWGDSIVENSQMHVQKRSLLRRLATAHPNPEDLIRTVPKRGFMLTLPPEAVRLEQAEFAGLC